MLKIVRPNKELRLGRQRWPQFLLPFWPPSFSAPRNRRAEDVCVIPIVVAELKLRNILRDNRPRQDGLHGLRADRSRCAAGLVAAYEQAAVVIGRLRGCSRATLVLPNEKMASVPYVRPVLSCFAV